MSSAEEVKFEVGKEEITVEPIITSVNPKTIDKKQEGLKKPVQNNNLLWSLIISILPLGILGYGIYRLITDLQYNPVQGTITNVDCSSGTTCNITVDLGNNQTTNVEVPVSDQSSYIKGQKINIEYNGTDGRIPTSNTYIWDYVILGVSILGLIGIWVTYFLSR